MGTNPRNSLMGRPVPIPAKWGQDEEKKGMACPGSGLMGIDGEKKGTTCPDSSLMGQDEEKIKKD